MPIYEKSLFEPPAPVAQVTVRTEASGPSISDVPPLMDTGADVTLLPTPRIAPLLTKLGTTGQYELQGFDGSLSVSSAVTLELVFLGKVFRGRFLLIDQDWGVMGRNVLNSIHLSFNGPSLTWGEAR